MPEILNPVLLQALSFARLNWPVLPLHEPTPRGCSCDDPNCSRVGKHPRTRGGVHDATTDSDVITNLWTRWPYANIGLATGSLSGISVVDVDGDEGRANLAALMKDTSPPPAAATVLTGRGTHHYYRTGNSRVRSQRLAPGLDLRADGAYVVTLRSRHASGAIYRRDLRRRSWQPLVPAALPDWLKPLIAAEPPSAHVTPPETARTHAYAEAALDDELDRLRFATEGERNKTLHLCAFRVGQLVEGGSLDVNAATDRMMAEALALGLGRAESAATIRSGLKAGQASPRTIELTNTTVSRSTEADALAQDLAALGETDADNAQRLVRRFGDRLVCTPGKGYLAFDGKCWCRDGQLRRFGFAEETARAITREAAHLPDPVRGAKRSGFAASSQSKGALDRMLDVAKHCLMKSDKLFDPDRYLLNVENGTLDLRTGKLRPHDPADLITKLVPVAYDAEAACPTFERLLNVALKGDAAVIAYLQKGVGYTLTGAMGEQVFFFLYGPGGTAKSTFINAIRDLMGDYGLHTPTETIMAKQHDNTPFDLARLEGARMVTAVEVNWTRHIDEARVKALTGGDPITARHLYRDFFEFQPACKLWFAANDLPGVRGTAEAFWRRVRLIPFEVVIPEDERDDKLPEKLRAEWSGILAWAVRGCLAWQCEGLIPPEAVRRGTEGWRRKADHLPRFCNEELIMNQQHFTTAHDLYAHYRAWCERHGETPLDVRKFKAALEGHGLSHKRTSSGSVWSGVKLRLQH